MTAPLPYTSGSPVAQKTNILAIVGLVLSIIGFTVIGIILGFVGLNQIKKTGESGRGIAIAAIIVGFAELIIGAIYIVVVIAAATSVSTY
ncbi:MULTISPECIES: DUF4190 domain-containing protein [Subtercola]|uniref:DUF4190 domain-containing protein n=1 Tax=Subtercola vilae TaxID=2056433 RepID=A0A4V4RFX2_9MICO|nr:MULTISPECIES: DUF4190 domain-containing protein [Subtercola]MEA9984519.1 DUF4190 domain-containing protein [Subtercola sp. RTI3]TIH39414.1 DUF4190 domain-containing protein [Subtercola vilae]